MLSLDVGASASIATAVIGTVVTVLGVVGYQGRRARLSSIRDAFNVVVAALASTDAEQQLAGAVLLRRFFDVRSEFGVRNLLGRRRVPYAEEARSVMAAVLRGLPTGHLQKLLADGLAFATDLENADLQGTNLQQALLSPRKQGSSLAGADFYHADLSGATLRHVHAPGAIFYEARLRGTIFNNADLRHANFYASDLMGAVFKNAQLFGADFNNAINVPAELEKFIDADGKYESEEPAPERPRDAPRPGKIFISAPSARSAAQQSVFDRVIELLARNDLEPEILTPAEYPSFDAMGEIFRRMNCCCAVLVFGLNDDRTETTQSAGLSPWTHLEAGMAYASDLPLLILRQPGVRTGAFDQVAGGHRTHIFDLAQHWDDAGAQEAMLPWIAEASRS